MTDPWNDDPHYDHREEMRTCAVLDLDRDVEPLDVLGRTRAEIRRDEWDA